MVGRGHPALSVMIPCPLFWALQGFSYDAPCSVRAARAVGEKVPSGQDRQGGGTTSLTATARDGLPFLKKNQSVSESLSRNV